MTARCRFLQVLVFICLATPAFAADDPNGPMTIKMTLRAQATTRPALAIRLLPSLTEQTPGDAAPIYLLAATLWNRDSNTAGKEPPAEVVKKFGLNPNGESWTWSSMLMEAPLAKLKSPELDEYLVQHHSALEMLEIASRREGCHWDLPFREQGFGTLLPHLQALRDASQAVCVKARGQLASGDTVGAMRTLRTNFAMARAMNQQAVLIQSLVGAAISASTLQVVREAAEVPGAANLYWTLADLPKPMFDLQVPMEWERSVLYSTLPQLKKAREGTFTDADWRELMRMMSTIMNMEGHPKDNPFVEQFKITASAILMYPNARSYLIGRGMTPEQVDAMPKSAALGRYMVESFDEVYDEITKWTKLPYWQAHAGMARSESELRELVPKTNPLLLVIPAVNRAMFGLRRLDRVLAAMQAAEGLRDYAARHDGTLPKSLDDVTETPIPIDPIWGKPFAYKVVGQTATLESPAPQEGKKADALVLTITIVP